jgi:hypothetical protein
MMKNLAEVLGVGLVIAGVSFIFPPAGLITAGLAVIAACEVRT